MSEEKWDCTITFEKPANSVCPVCHELAFLAKVVSSDQPLFHCRCCGLLTTCEIALELSDSEKRGGGYFDSLMCHRKEYLDRQEESLRIGKELIAKLRRHQIPT